MDHPGIFEVTADDIEYLKSNPLRELLEILVYTEAQALHVPRSNVQCSSNENAPDGGLDANISGITTPGDWFKGTECGFQCKAEAMSAKKFTKELQNDAQTEIKSCVEELIKNDGCYILFCGKKCSTEMLRKRREAFINVFVKYGYKENKIKNQICVYGADEIKNWTNDHLAAVNKVFEFTGKMIPHSCKTWDEWGRYGVFTNKFYTNDRMIKKINAIRSSLQQPGSCHRVLGLSGTGKSRLVYESFRGGDQGDDWTHLCCYMDQPDKNRLIESVNFWVRNRTRGVLVVDNCEEELHKRLMRCVYGDSNLSLVTIDYNIDENSQDYKITKIYPSENEDIVKKMLFDSFENKLDRNNIERISEFAQGFPVIAKHLAESRLRNEIDIGVLKDDDIILKNLLWGREEPDPKKEEIIKACSLFENFGYLAEARDELKFIAENICEKTSHNFARKTVIELKKRGIIDTRGRYGQIVPLPLAVRLAADWWMECEPDIAYSLIKNDMPAGMKRALCDRLSKLHFVKESREIVEDLCGECGPFGSAKVLNTREGSRLFRPLVEVNPQATTVCLHRIFASESKDFLLNIEEGRRDLIWALEKLCFWEDTFEDAAKTLFAFAWGENEDISNNATSQFLQLFHIYMSGTQKSAIERLNVLRDILQENDDDKTRICIFALGESLKIDHFQIFDTVRSQGSRATLDYWEPENVKDVVDYLDTVAEMLIPFCQRDDELGVIAREQFKEKIGPLLGYKYYNFVLKVIKEIRKEYKGSWISALKEIKSYYRLYKEVIQDENEKAQINEMEDLLRPEDLSDKIELIITSPEYDIEHNSEGTYIDNAERRALDFISQLSKDLPILLENIESFYTGILRYGFRAGNICASIIGYNDSIIEKSITAIRNIIKKGQKPDIVFLGGYFNTLQSEHYQEINNIVDIFRNDPLLVSYYVGIIRTLPNQKKYLLPLIDLIKNKKISASSVKILSYQPLSLKEFDSFCRELSVLGEEGLSAISQIIYDYNINTKKGYGELLPLLDYIFIEFNVFLLPYDSMDYHYFQQLLEPILKERKNIALARKVTADIIEACETNNFMRDRFFVNTIVILLTMYLEEIWDLFADKFLSENYTSHQKIILLFDGNSGLDEKDSGFFTLISVDFLKNWLMEHPEAAKEVARCIAVVKKEADENLQLTERAMMLIDTFGDNDNVLYPLGGNLLHFGSWGPVVPHYAKRIGAIQPLVKHSNPNVRKWAKEILVNLNEYMDSETQREDEKYLRT